MTSDAYIAGLRGVCCTVRKDPRLHRPHRIAPETRSAVLRSIRAEHVATTTGLLKLSLDLHPEDEIAGRVHEQARIAETRDLDRAAEVKRYRPELNVQGDETLRACGPTTGLQTSAISSDGLPIPLFRGLDLRRPTGLVQSFPIPDVETVSSLHNLIPAPTKAL